MKNTQNKILALLVAGVVGSTGVAQAATFDTLANLSANPANSISIGDKTFSGFSYLDSNLTGFNANNILVTASVVGADYYLTWGGSIALLSGGPAVADLLLNYTVTASAGLIIGIDQLYTGSAQPAGGAFLAVDETIRTPFVNSGGTIIANSSLSTFDLSDPFAEFNDDLSTLPGYSVLYVTKDIAFGVVNGGFVTISEVRQSFHQQVSITTFSVPDGGTTVMLLGVAITALGLIRRKIAA